MIQRQHHLLEILLPLPSPEGEKTPEIDARESPLRLIAVHSPVSWGHINVLGEYDSSEEKGRDTLYILPPKKAP